jgi:hypothetical protein
MTDPFVVHTQDNELEKELEKELEVMLSTPDPEMTQLKQQLAALTLMMGKALRVLKRVRGEQKAQAVRMRSLERALS